MNDAALAAWTAARLPMVEDALRACFADAFPPRLQEACRYPIGTGGKRIRPLLCLAAAESVAGDWRAAMPAAVALELLHTYSLVHDDLPCMDDDDERRGWPTVHKVYGEGVAVLVGDALLTEAFTVLGAYDDGRCATLVRELSRAGGAVGMIAGQALDVGMDGPIVGVDPLVRLHRAKTGALLRASVRMGALAVGADAAVVGALSRYGDAVGLAFQVQDDVLDADQDAGEDGPPSFVKLYGLQGAREAALRYAEEARAATSSLPRPDALLGLARRIVERTT